MKALIVFLMSPFMLMFFLAGLQSIEFCIVNGLLIPLPAWGLFFPVTVWMIAAYKCSKESLNEARRKCEQFIIKALKKL